MEKILEGIVIGAAGGAIAGLTVWLVQYLHGRTLERIHKERVYAWLVENTRNVKGKQFRSTRAIASWNNLTMERVQYICSVDDRIRLSTGKTEDLWTLEEYELGKKPEETTT